MKWIKIYNRPNSIQRAQSYAEAMGKPFKKYFGLGIFNWMNVFHDGTSDYYVDKKELEDFEKYSAIKFIEDINFYRFIEKNYINQFLEHERYLRETVNKDLTRLEKNEIIELFCEYRKKIVNCFSFMWLIAICEKPMERALAEIFKKYVDKNKIDESVKIVFSQTTGNYLSEEENELLRISNLNKKDRINELNKHFEKYRCISMYDYDHNPYSIDYFRERLNNLDKKKVIEDNKRIDENKIKFNELINKVDLTEEDKIKVMGLNLLYNFKDQRSYYRSIDSFFANKIYLEISKRINIPLKRLIFLLDNEIIELLNGDLKEINFSDREKFCLIIFSNEKNKLLIGKNAEDYLKNNPKLYYKEEIKGLVGFKGLVNGRTKVILKPADIIKVNKGDILVASMTRPDYVSAMKKAAAIITDEGGITSHAAIICREFKIPCIIGTKIATQVLHDGDLVEVDANKGVVKILENKNDQDNSTISLVNNYIKLNNIDIQKARASLFNVSLCFYAYTNSYKIHGLNFPFGLFYIKNKNFSQISSINEIKQYTRLYYNDYIQGNNRFNNFLLKQEKIIKEIEEKVKNIKNNEEIVNTIELLSSWWYYGIVGEDKGKYYEEEMMDIFRKKELDNKEIENYVNILATPEKQSVFAKQQKMFYILCKNFLEKKNIDEKISDYIKEFYYINTTFYDYDTLTKEKIKEKIKIETKNKNIQYYSNEIKKIERNGNEIIKNRKEIMSRFRFNKEEKRKLEFLHLFADWLNTRKENMMKTFYYMADIVHKISKEKNIPYEKLAYYSIYELKELLINGKKVEEEIINKRNDGCIAVIFPNKTDFIYAEDAKKVYENAHNSYTSEHNNKNVIKGNIAYSSGKTIQGRVKIIKDPSIEDFKEGDILVTTMTRIEFVPIIKKASAIITDEGGISCHAAIVAREFKIPCIISTKIATLVLHDGDLVEVDANKGVVKILERYGK